MNTPDDRRRIRLPNGIGVTIGVLCIVMLLGGLMLAEPLYGWWLAHVRAPLIEDELGFTAEQRLVTPTTGQPYHGLFIASVRAGGTFERSGVRAGDAVVCLHHGVVDFWAEMNGVRSGHSARLEVVSSNSVTTGCAGARTITIVP